MALVEVTKMDHQQSETAAVSTVSAAQIGADTDSTPPDISLENLAWLQTEISREQDHYWQRFASFATLHTGFLVLATSQVVSRPRLLYSAALLLGVVWSYVQLASLYYVDRFKPRFHAVREARELTFRKHPVFSRSALSSTKIALAAPVAVTVLWLVFTIDAFRAP